MSRLLNKLAFANPWLVLLVWGSFMALHATYYVQSILASFPAGGEWYARSHSYQLLAFSFVRFPLWLVLLGAYFGFRGYWQGKASVPSKRGQA
jgi:hypothetical protein